MEKKKEETKEKKKVDWKKRLLGLLILVLALAPRLYYLFFVSGIENAGAGWYGDTYHHWQIAYLSKEVGFSHGFLRLWDFKGMEYYWGLLHPLLLAFFFTVTGSVDIVIPRLLSIVCGSLSIVLIFLLAKRYWKWQVGLVAAVLAALNPVVIFNDASGMLEPLGLVLLLSGIWFWPRKPVLTGVFWALASWARADAWLISLGMLFVVSLTRKKTDKKVLMFIGYFIPMLFYLKVLLDRTGNPIYPLWWNYFALAVGKWQYSTGFTSQQLAIRPIFGAIFAIFSLLLVYLLVKRPRGFLLLALGSSVTAFIFGFIGLTAYLSSYTSWFWMVRFFVFPYIFLGLLISIFLFWFIPRKLKLLDKLKLNWLVFLAILIAIQPAWRSIWSVFKNTYRTWETKKDWALEVAKQYQGGTILIPEYEMDFTYALVRFGKISGKNLEGQMYTPFAYPPFSDHADDLFANWEEEKEIFFDWLKDRDIRLIIVAPKRESFKTLFLKEPGRFEFIKNYNSYDFWRVK